MNQEETLKRNFDEIEAALAPADGMVAAGGLDDLCKKYHEIRPKIETVVAIMENIPIQIVRQAAKLIRALMAICDMACPVNP